MELLGGLEDEMATIRDGIAWLAAAALCTTCGGSTSSTGHTHGDVDSVGGTSGAVEGAAGSTGGVQYDLGIAGGEFLWSGYDLPTVEIDEAASGTPVALDDPGNEYGRILLWGQTLPPPADVCTDGGFGIQDVCMEFTICTIDCSTVDDCPAPDSGTATPQCGDPSFGDRCMLPCGGESVCPDGMACVQLTSGFRCTWPAPVLDPGCPGYCAQLGGSCDARTAGECCEGLVCAPWDECEEGECLRETWPCSEDTAPCCDGLTCTDDACVAD